MRRKGRVTDVLIAIFVIYVFLGFGIVSVQALSGAPCGPIKLGGDYVYEINRHAPQFWLWRAFHWVPTAYENLVREDRSLGDFLLPRECLWVPDGMSPADVEEE